MVRSRMYLARNGVVIGGQYAAYGLRNAHNRLRVAASFNQALKQACSVARYFQRICYDNYDGGFREDLGSELSG